MKLWVLGAIAAATLATPASAGLTTSAYNQPAPPGATVLTFDSALPSGFSLYGGKIVQGSVPGQYAAPAGDATKYLTTGDGKAVIGTNQAYQSVSFYWGSIDTYNAVTLLDSAFKVIAKFSGYDLPPANGDQSAAATNRYVTYTLDAGSPFAGISTIVFDSFGKEFEVDDVAFGGPGKPASVPEPATMGLFAVGLAAMGRRALRRRAA